MFQSHATVLLFVYVVQSTYTMAFGQQCERLEGSFREQCAVTGYNQTYKIPYEMSSEAREVIKEILGYSIDHTTNCSVGAIGETMMCSVIYAPYCIEGQDQPQLPCRRVCAEYLNRCFNPNNFIDEGLSLWVAYFYGLCTLLPNKTAASGECFEPPRFEDHYNSSSIDLLHATCQPNLIPWCQDVNYNYTILPTYVQLKTYKAIYRKNFTGDPVVDAEFSNITWIHWFDVQLKKFPKCAKMLKMIICADRLPPCFLGETPTLYTACKSVCKTILETCPEIRDSPLQWYVDQCEVTAFDNSSRTFCAHKKWPNPHEWLHQKDLFGFKPTTQPPPPKSSVGAGVIVAAVLVPIIVVCLLIAGVFLWRNRKLPFRYFDLKAEDRKDLVT